MSTFTPPVFNLTAANVGFSNDEELEEALAKTGGSFFDSPGNYDLVISAAEFYQNKDTGDIYCKGDKTWVSVKVTLSSTDGKSIAHWIQVPTATFVFGEGKIITPFRNFQMFMFGIGEKVSSERREPIDKYFNDLKKLVGQKVNVDLGYKGDYVTRADDGSYVIMVKGKPLQEDGVDVKLPDRGSAIQYAKVVNIEPGFLKVLKFTPKKSAKAKTTTPATDW